MKSAFIQRLVSGFFLVLSFSAFSLSIKNQFFEILEIHADQIEFSEEEVQKLKDLQDKMIKNCSRERGATIVILEAVLPDGAAVQEVKSAYAKNSKISSWLVSIGVLEGVIFSRVVNQKAENESRSSIGRSRLPNRPNTVSINIACNPSKSS